MKISKDLLKLTKNVGTPFILIDEAKVLDNYKKIKAAINGSRIGIYYSVKANNHPKVLRALNKEGSGFDVASIGEIDLLKNLKVDPKRITFSAPTKIPADIKEAYKYGVRLFAFDSETELEKLSKLAPNSNVFLRIIVSNIGSEWPLVRKFGAPAEKALHLFTYAKKLGLNPYGIAFHVGSQCHNKNTWIKAIKKSAKIWEQAVKHGFNLKLLNMGGGFPVRYKRDVPSVEDISNAINKGLSRYFSRHNINVIIEPGRFIVGDSAILVTSVISKVKRGRESWLYLDTGVYNGLQETLEGWRYEIVTEKNGPKKKYILAGPTCDSTDIIGKGVKLPNLEMGDKLYFLSAGAYTNSYEHYNGIDYPKILFSYNKLKLTPTEKETPYVAPTRRTFPKPLILPS